VQFRRVVDVKWDAQPGQHARHPRQTRHLDADQHALVLLVEARIGAP
jgi:hypothetical protein